MKLKVAELEGRLLDEAVAKAEGWIRASPTINGVQMSECWWLPCFGSPINPSPGANPLASPKFSVSWQQGGPIIERERIETGATRSGRWGACVFDSHEWQYGPTILIAAMRCYVESKFGPEIEME